MIASVGVRRAIGCRNLPAAILYEVFRLVAVIAGGVADTGG
jgi:hypothetical protein